MSIAGPPEGFGGPAATSAEMARIYIPAQGIADWQSLLADPVRQWRAGYSAMAAAQSWQAAAGLPPEIDALLGGETELQLAIPEHKVPLPGRGADSQCDVFALVQAGAQGVALAIEAKVDEPFGPTVAEWLRPRSDNKQFRLSAICDLLGLDGPPPEVLRYQLLHRTAAAVLEAQRFRRPVAAMVVQSFSPGARWLEDFEAFARALDMDAGYGRLGRKRLPCGTELWIGWAQGAPDFLADPTQTGETPAWTG